MSHWHLRRAMVRLMHDPALADRVSAGNHADLRDADLTAAELAWLTTTPRAAWRTDPERPARVLAALLDEYPATARRAPALPPAFFASAAFHYAIQHRGSLAMAMGDFLMTSDDLDVRATAAVERAITAVRRAPQRVTPSAPAMLRLAPSVVLLDDRTPPLLVVRTPAGDVTVEEVTAALAPVFTRARDSAPRQALLAAIRDQGATPDEALAVLDDLVRDGLLV